ncbi:MAG: aminotransferase class I/II-fold pyridoxal phosphate-dependent enzyme [Gemmatimonadetes bacterium]|nr:aminotransferase class I/II-fold pyridoxal phosphate-dependent enzyme [Gemmatimonadota bacterium]NNM04144.1 aminotransferase class I/II-fold pyridoxal phosphate-dependent enzyme [Gemmatimonadota bacterium]
MKRRAFLRNGLMALGAPAVLPATARADVFLTPRQRRQSDDPIRLSSNENPLGIPPGSREAIIGGIEDGNRYPGNSRRALQEAVAQGHGVPSNAIVLGNGSTEILQMGVQAKLHPELRLVAPAPTFEDVFEYSEPHPWIDLKPIPLLPDYAHDLSAMEEATKGAPGPVLVYVCNPNNPTGSLTPVGDVESWIRRAPENVHFLVDEAYFEFVDSGSYRSLDQLAVENPNVVVARTFSKVYGMAGIRLGYGIAHPETARVLQAFAAGTNCNHLALVAGLAALNDGEWVAKSVGANLESRQVTYAVLEELGLEYLPSHTNFVMHRISGDLRQYINRMREAGIRVGRPFPPMLEFNRLSLGLPEEMERHADTLRDFRRRGWI